MNPANKTPIEIKLTQDKWFAYNSLAPVFQYLEAEDLLRAAQVCKMWHWIITHDESILFSKTFATCEVHLSALVDKFGDKIRNIEIDGLARTTSRCITKNIRKMPNLRRLILADCRLLKLNQIVNTLNPDIKAIQIEQTHREHPVLSYSLEFIKKFSNLTYVGLMSLSCIDPKFFSALEGLEKLRHLYLYIGCEHFDLQLLQNLTRLTVLHLGGDTTTVLNRRLDVVSSVFKNLVNLYKIKLELYPDCNYNFFKAFKQMPNLKELEINGQILSKETGTRFIQELSQCTNLTALTVEMDPELILSVTVYDHAIRNTLLSKAVIKLKNSLRHFYWLVPAYYIKEASDIWGRHNCILFQKFQKKQPQTLDDIRVINVKRIEEKLGRKMPTTKVFVLVQYYDYRYCPDCKDQ